MTRSWNETSKPAPSGAACDIALPKASSIAGRQIADSGQFRWSAVDAVADLDRVFPPGQMQAQLADAGRQVCDRPAGVRQRYYRAEPNPAVDELDARLEPVLLVHSHHGPGLVVLVAVSPADPD